MTRLQFIDKHGRKIDYDADNHKAIDLDIINMFCAALE